MDAREAGSETLLGSPRPYSHPSRGPHNNGFAVAALIVFWCAVGMIGALVLGALTPWLANPAIKMWAASAHLVTSLGLLLLLAVPVIGVVGIVLSSVGFHRAHQQGGNRRRLALGTLICNCAVTLLGLPVCWFLLSVISNVRSW